ncbi:MAG: DUF2177 family protein [Rubricella sp.]
MLFLAAFAIALVLFVAVDAVWLTKISAPAFRRELGPVLLENPRFGAAAGFYLIYIAALVGLAILPTLAEGWLAAARTGALVGLAAYATYEFTNMATVKGWKWHLVLTDTAWGTALSGLVSALTVLALGALGF